MLGKVSSLSAVESPLLPEPYVMVTVTNDPDEQIWQMLLKKRDADQVNVGHHVVTTIEIMSDTQLAESLGKGEADAQKPV